MAQDVVASWFRPTGEKYRETIVTTVGNTGFGEHEGWETFHNKLRQQDICYDRDFHGIPYDGTNPSRQLTHYRWIGDRWKIIDAVTPASTGNRRTATNDGRFFTCFRETGSSDRIQRMRLRGAEQVVTVSLDTTTKSSVMFDGSRYNVGEFDGASNDKFEDWHITGSTADLLQTLTGETQDQVATVFDGRNMILGRANPSGTGYRLLKKDRTSGLTYETYVDETPTNFQALCDITFNGRDIIALWVSNTSGATDIEEIEL